MSRSGAEPVAGLVLAAGQGRRYGMPKALVETGTGAGRRLLVEHAVDTLRAGGCDPVIVVLGADAERVRSVAKLAGALVADNPDWATGMASSLRAGLTAAGSLAVPPIAVTVLLVDTPGVTPAAVRRIRDHASADALVVATYHGQPGHPVLLGRDHWAAAAAAATGDTGARRYLGAHPDQVREVACHDIADGTDLDVPPAAPIRLAMWSGPRNISTAMMRSFGARSDCVVVDEPLYAHYLATTGIEHPGRDEVLASQPTDWRVVAAELTGPLPGGIRVQYQKQMAHHLLDSVGRDWLGSLRHAYLVRDPAHVVASYAKVRGTPTLADLGYPQQVELFRRYGGPVVDAADVLRDPSTTLAALCAALGIEFQPRMLSWPAGSQPTDGVWAPYWYAAVNASTGFAAYDPSPPSVPERLAALVRTAQPYYDELAAHRLSG